MEHLFVAIGMAGVVLVLLAYGLISSGRMTGEDVRYQLINIAGTTGILISLIAQWNLPSFIANAAWLMVGFVGLIRIWRKRRTV